jgi:hypothetical protein
MKKKTKLPKGWRQRPDANCSLCLGTGKLLPNVRVYSACGSPLNDGKSLPSGAPCICVVGTRERRR